MEAPIPRPKCPQATSAHAALWTTVPGLLVSVNIHRGWIDPTSPEKKPGWIPRVDFFVARCLGWEAPNLRNLHHRMRRGAKVCRDFLKLRRSTAEDLDLREHSWPACWVMGRLGEGWKDWSFSFATFSNDVPFKLWHFGGFKSAGMESCWFLLGRWWCYEFLKTDVLILCTSPSCNHWFRHSSKKMLLMDKNPKQPPGMYKPLVFIMG